ncbi:deaminated glutathione amidase, chloroplastic/cytosolic-like [Salvia hispanica]|uniref:deaminated glutathione amidase, chloroplastic/cytosolic-like n=1 Tax=Salvia hispanica TaxID=49212 RepID=UPI0020094132|nr:deaminated glutathione amidase, chloroplastic/cytosolic-like [Salvia hispanica]
MVAVDSPFGRLGLSICYDLRFPEIYQQLRFNRGAEAGNNSADKETYGGGMIIDPWGKVSGRLPDRLSTGIAVADIDFAAIDSIRKKMPIDQHRKPSEFWRSLEKKQLC